MEYQQAREPAGARRPSSRADLKYPHRKQHIKHLGEAGAPWLRFAGVVKVKLPAICQTRLYCAVTVKNTIGYFNINIPT
jgi:hypothetical protein